MGTRYEEGDVVATPNGRGVVAAVLTEGFEFPQDEDDEAEVSASDGRPAHVVGLESGGSAVYRASALSTTGFEDEPESTDGEALTEVVDESVNGLDSLPEGWDRESVLEYWAGIGGTWEACVEEMREEFGEERAKEHCSAMKDELLGTERWRNRV
ncbi:hypothetical protein [Natronorarus salvus]|uniref:hypothetical protein n=1 Tax=Natronorarus salvus TaxID=3117733 RepID=UPI002F25F9AF